MIYNILKQRLKAITQKAYDLLQDLQRCKDEGNYSLEKHYLLYKNMEEMLFEYGTLVSDIEVETERSDSNDFQFDDTALTTAQTRELNQYLKQYCGNRPDSAYSLSRYMDGYKAVLPFLLNRRAVKGLHYSPKKKYVVQVFRKLLEANEANITKLTNATIIIVSYMPFGNRVVRDSDNADSRDIINLIKRYILDIDDSGEYVNVCYDTRRSIEGDYKTEVFIIPKRSFDPLFIVR